MRDILLWLCKRLYLNANNHENSDTGICRLILSPVFNFFTIDHAMEAAHKAVHAVSCVPVAKDHNDVIKAAHAVHRVQVEKITSMPLKLQKYIHITK